MAETFVPITTSNLTNQTSITNAIDTNNGAIANLLTDVLSRSGSSPNQMLSTLDMNSNQIINLPAPASVNSPARLIDVVTNPTITVPPVGTSGATVPLLNGNNTWSGTNTFLNQSTVAGMPAVKLYPASNQTNSATVPWLLFDPYGNQQTISSTTTSGLQEAINYAYSIGADLEVFNPYNVAVTATTTGSTTLGSNVITVASTTGIVIGDHCSGPGTAAGYNVVTAIGSGNVTVSQNAASSTSGTYRFASQLYPMTCHSAITMPPVQNFNMRMSGVYVGFSSFAGPAWIFDSCMSSYFDFSNAVLTAVGIQTSFYEFFPRSPVPFDNSIQVNTSVFKLGSPVLATTTPNAAVIFLNPALGPISSNRFEASEINGNGQAYVGFEIANPGVNIEVEGNIFDLVTIHSMLQYGVQIGSSSVSLMGGNVWRIGGIAFDNGSLTSTYSVLTWGSNDIFNIGQIAMSGSGSAGTVAFGSSGNRNTFNYGKVTGTTVGNNYGSSSGNILIGNGSISLNGSAYTNP